MKFHEVGVALVVFLLEKKLQANDTECYIHKQNEK